MSQGKFKADNEQAKAFARWPMPEVAEEIDYATAPTNALGLKPGQRHQEVVEEEEELPVLTAEDLELIRKAAYEEGMLQGHEEGHAKGYAAGHEEGLTKGHQEGFEQGQKEGEAAGAALIEERAEMWSALARQFEQPLMHLDKEVEQSLIGLVVELAEEVIRCELQTNPNIILKVLREATNALPLSARKLAISVNPEDAALIDAAYSEEMLAERGWQINADPSLDRGECQISSEQSYVHISTRQRVKELMERFVHQSVPPVKANEPTFANTHQPQTEADPATDEDPATPASSAVDPITDAQISEHEDDAQSEK